MSHMSAGGRNTVRLTELFQATTGKPPTQPPTRSGEATTSNVTRLFESLTHALSAASNIERYSSVLRENAYHIRPGILM